MTIEAWLMFGGFIMAGYGFWFKDWKSKIDDKLIEYEISKEKLNREIHALELELSKRITREEINSVRQEIKDDFHEFKNELRDMMKKDKL